MQNKRGKSRGKKKLILIFLLLLALIGGGLYARRVILDSRNVIATVNGYKIRISDIEAELMESPEIYRTIFREDPMSVLDNYINQIILFREAKKHESAYSPEIEARVNNYYIKTLTRMYVDEQAMLMADISENDIIDYYNNNLNEFLVPQKVRIYEIVVPSTQQAEQIQKRLAGGEAFQEIASNYSISPSSSRGGDLGWMETEKLEPEIADLVTRIDAGEILADIIKTEMGYHILKSGGRTPRRLLSIDEARESIRQVLVQRSKRDSVNLLLQDLRRDTDVRIYDNRLNKLTERIR